MACAAALLVVGAPAGAAPVARGSHARPNFDSHLAARPAVRSETKRGRDQLKRLQVRMTVSLDGRNFGKRFVLKAPKRKRSKR